MYLREIIVEAFDRDTAISAFKNIVTSYATSLHGVLDILKQKSLEGDLKSGKRLAGLKKAKWVSDNYLGMAGMEAAARELRRYYGQGSVGTALAQLASIRLSAFTGSGKSKVFDEIGVLLVTVGANITEESIQYTISKVQEIRTKISDVIGKLAQPSQPKSPEKKKDSLAGQQNAQAEQAFSQILNSLPKDIRHQVRMDTARMSPSEKLKYLRKMMER